MDKDRSSAEARLNAPQDASFKLEEFLPYRLNVVAALASQALSRIYTARYGIGVPEWRVLVTLGHYGVMTGKAIGAHSHMHKTKVSRAVALLESRKLLVRRANKADMRVTMEKPMTKPPAVGANVDVIGVISEYTPDPFMFTMTKADLPGAKPAAKTPAKKGPTKKGTAKKKTAQ